MQGQAAPTPSDAMMSWTRTHAGSAVLGGAAVFLLYALWLWPVLWGQAALYTRDILLFVVPYKAEAGRLMAAGHFPWLSPRLMGGIPLWGHPSAEIADPVSWLFALGGNPHTTWGWVTLLHGTLAGAGAALLARTLGIRGGARMWAAVAYAVCGPVMALWAIKAVPNVALPWVMAAGAYAGRSPHRAVAGTAFSTAFLLLHPDPPSVAPAALLAAALCAARAPAGARVVRVAMLGIAGACGALLAAVYLLPAWEVIRESPRTAVSQWSAATSLGRRWVELVAPGGLGVPGTTGSLLGAMRQVTRELPFVGSLYLGASVLVAGTLGPRARLARVDRVLLGAVVLLVVLAHGDAVPGTGALWTAVHARFPEKLLPAAYLCAILWAARNIQRLRRRNVTRAAPWAWVLMGGAGSVLAPRLAAWWLDGVQGLNNVALELLAGQASLGLGLVALAGLAGVACARRPEQRAPALVLVAVLDGTVCSLVAFPTTPLENLAAPHTLLAEHGRGERRVSCCHVPALMLEGATATSPEMPPDTAAVENAQRLAPSLGVTHGLSYPVASDVGGFGPVEMQRALVWGLPALPPQQALNVLAAWGVELAVSLAPLPAAPNVEKVERGRQPPLWVARLAAAPDWYATPTWQSAEDEGGTMEVLARGGANPAVLTAPQGEVPKPAPAAGSAPAPTLAVQEHSPTHATLDVTSEVPVMLVHSAALRGGWSATLDGATTTAWRTNIIHVGVLVPEGTHRVELVYNPPGFPAGLALSVVALALLGMHAVVTRAKRRARTRAG